MIEFKVTYKNLTVEITFQLNKKDNYAMYGTFQLLRSHKLGGFLAPPPPLFTF